MKTNRVLAGLVALFTVLTVFAALPTVPAKAAAEPNVLYLAMQQDIPDFNYWSMASNSVWKANVINWGLEGLVGLDYDGLPMPVLAESWTFDEPTLTWTFNLRHGVTFHDGTPMTADDVVFIYKVARDGTAPSANIINAFDGDGDGAVSQAEIDAGVTKVDDFTVKMKMATSYGLFLSSTAQLPIMPKAIWEKHLTTEGVIDMTWGTDSKATISTGPWKYKEGAQNTYRIMEKYTGYWGKNQTTPNGYKFYPPNVDQLYYKIYASIDTAILALQSGAVDYITWPVTAGRVPSLQADPNLKMSYLSDNGYFYLAFNEKFQPMNNVSFRRAVSHLIDKDQIVNIYMGGFGTKGSATEPPFWGEWFNNTVETWPFDSTLTTSMNMLIAAGFTDQNGDGWRDLPDGTPMPKITILTPPADYDPVRIRAGQMIAKNMRAAGINAEAKAIDFDTLVTRLTSMDFQMLIIGWSLSSEPVGNVFDIIGPKASQNTFGFWSIARPNPLYKDLFGVSTLADASTQAAADKVDDLGILARSSFNVTNQIKYTKWAEGVIANYVPVNVLYYRVNIYAYRNTWTGWLPYLGDLFGPGVNLFSLSNLQKTGAGGAAVGASASVNAGLSLPGKVSMSKIWDNTADPPVLLRDNKTPAYVTAVDNVGAPVSGAAVTVTTAGVVGSAPVTASPTSGTTDAAGVFRFNVTAKGDADGYSYVNVSAAKGGVTSTQSGTIRVVRTLPTSLALKSTVDSLVLLPGDSTDVTLKVTNENGAAVSGANVSIDPNLVAYGTINWTQNYALTNAAGEAYMTYTAPSVINDLNAHLAVTLSFTATKTGYAWGGAAASNLMIYNTLAPNWTMAQIESVTTTALTVASNTTTISVSAVDDDGIPLANHPMNITYSDESRVYKPVISVVTDGAGLASFDVQLKDSTASFALRVTIKNATVLNAMPATITLTHAGTGTVPTMYGGYMTWDTHYLIPDAANDYIEATAHVWDQDGVAADGINASLVVSGTSYGSLVWNDYIYWDSTWDGWGINIVTAEDNANLVTSGPFTSYYDFDNWLEWGIEKEYLYWIPKYDTDYNDTMIPVDVTGGTVTIGIYTQDWAPVDLIGSVYLVPDGLAFFNGTLSSYQITGPTTISGDYVIGRSYTVVAPNVAMAKPILTAKSVGYDSTTVTMTVTNETNTPIKDATAKVYENSIRGNVAYSVFPSGGIKTSSSGVGTSTIITIGKNGVVTQASMRADVYAKASKTYAVAMFAQNSVIIHVAQAYVDVDPITDVQTIGDKMLVKVSVSDTNGNAVAGLPVELSVGGGATVAQSTLASDASGVAVFEVDTSEISNARAAFIPVQAKAAGAGYEVALFSMMVPAKNNGPAISVLSPASGGSVVKTNVTLLLSAYDANGIQSVKYSLDGGTMVTLTGTAGAATWDVSKSVGKLAGGSHTLKVNATDSLGITSEVSVTFDAVKEKVGSSALAWGVAAVGWIVAALVVVMMLMRKPKAPEASMPEPAKPEEETEKKL